MSGNSCMEVKDVRSSKLIVENKLSQPQPAKSEKNNERTGDSGVVASQVKNNSKTQVRKQLNDVINVTNVAKVTTSQIDKMVQSISGIIKQVSKEEIPQQRRIALEKEANQLVEEIRKAAETKASNGLKPLAGDKIRLEVEEKIGKTLDVILPDDAKNAFGIASINFSTKDSIIATIASVQSAQESILKLKDAVESANKNISSAAATIDVALQNNEASEVSIRDLDQALKKATETRSVISANPDKAIQSLGNLSANSLGLLE